MAVLFQSEPRYVPLKLESQEKSSDGESDDSSVKSVRFSKLTEVLMNVLCVPVIDLLHCILMSIINIQLIIMH